MWGQRLDLLLEELLRGVYRAWYSLPRRSTLEEVERLCRGLAETLASLPRPLDSNAYDGALIGFAAALRNLPGIEAAAGYPLTELAEATPGAEEGGFGGRANSDSSAERVQQLIDLLRLPNPPQAMIAEMSYAPGLAEEDWVRVWETIRGRLAEMPAGEAAEIEAVAERVGAASAVGDTMQRQAAFLAGLQALERIPAVIRVAAAVLLDIKYEGTAPTFMGASKDVYAYTHAAQALPQMADSGLETLIEPAAPAQPEETRVPFYADVRFPTQVKRDEVQWLSVQLRLEQSAESRTQEVVGVPFPPTPPGETPPPAYVEVRLSAPGFREVTGVWERTMLVYAKADSQPVVFLLSASATGRTRLTLDFYHQGRMLATLGFESEVVQSATLRGVAPATPVESLEMGELIANPPPPADLELRVTHTAESNGLSFVLSSSLLELPLRSLPVGQIQLTGKDPQAFFAERLQKLTELARGTPEADTSERMAQKVARLGEELFERLLPIELQKFYWERIAPLAGQGTIKTLLINSDEPWIPWELIKPYRWNDADDSEQSGPFLVEQFTFSRWLARPLPAGVNVQQAALVMPDLDLRHVQEERTFFDTLAQEHQLQLLGPLKLHEEVLDQLRSGGFQLLHFATHGVFNAADAERSELRLGDENLTPADLVGGDLRGLRKARPLVFLNACESGKEELTLVGAGGWAHKFFAEGRATAFVGTLWEVSDDLAADFSRFFYSGLAEGKTLGEALRGARLQIRELAPSNPTWLAYALYGDPNAKVTFG